MSRSSYEQQPQVGDIDPETRQPIHAVATFTTRYAWSACLCFNAVSCFTSFYLSPCIVCAVHMQQNRRRAFLTDTYLRVQDGVCVKDDKSIPLERIQDLAVSSNCFDRCCGTESLLVQTAGNSGKEGRPEGSLLGIVDGRAFKRAVLERRDAMSGIRAPSDGTSGVSAVASSSVMAAPLGAAGNALAPLEAHLQRQTAAIEEMNRNMRAMIDAMQHRGAQP